MYVHLFTSFLGMDFPKINVQVQVVVFHVAFRENSSTNVIIQTYALFTEIIFLVFGNGIVDFIIFLFEKILYCEFSNSKMKFPNF